MKRRIIFAAMFITLLAALFTFAGCFGEEAPPPEVKIEQLYGTWTHTNDKGEETTYTFYDNQKYTKSERDVNTRGTYVLEGNILKITPSEGLKTTEHEITEFYGTKMVWGKWSVTAEYIKQ